MKPTGEIPFEGVEEENRFVDLFRFASGQLVLLSSQKKKEEKIRLLYGQLFDLEGMPITGQKVLSTIYLREGQKEGDFHTTLSDDGDSLLVIKQSTTEKFKNQNLQFLTFDKQLRGNWAKEVKVPYPSQSFSLINFNLHHSNRVVFLATVFPTNYSSFEKIASDNYLLFNYNHQKNELQEFEINLDRKWVTEIAMRSNEDSEIILSGYYSNNREHIARGVFYLRMNVKTNSVVQSNLKEFPVSTLSYFMKERKAKKGKGIDDYFLKNCFVFNGETYLIGEQSYTLEECYTQFRTGLTTCDNHHYYNGIMVNKLDSTGNLQNTSYIPKKQHTSNDNGFYSSFVAFFTEDSLRILYNDHPDNLRAYPTGETKYMTSPSNSTVTMASDSHDSDFHYRKLFNSKKEGNIFKPWPVHFGSKTVLLIFIKRRNYKLASVRFGNQ